MIAIQPGSNGREILAILSSKEPYYFGPPRHRDDVPVGSVEWVSRFLCNPVTPDYYPEYLSHMLHRNVWRTDTWPLGNRIAIRNEWRYYVGDNEILATGWYSGEDECSDAPKLDTQLLGCGAFDFAELLDGRIALIEWQHPFACGWYGEDRDAYIEWLKRGWKELNRFY